MQLSPVAIAAKIHAEKSASGSFRWAICHASVIRQRGKPDNGGNMAAKRGTVAHDLAEQCLRARSLKPLSDAMGLFARVNRNGTVDFFKTELVAGEGCVDVDDQIVAWVEGYYEFVMRLAMGGELFVEESLSIEHITGEDGAKGTTDACVVYSDEVTVIDLKTGFEKIHAAYAFNGDLFKYGPEEFKLRALFENIMFPNPQLLIYADATIRPMRFFRNIKRVRLIVYQPSLDWIDEHVIEIADFDAWVQWLREQSAAAEGPEPRVVPGEKQCKYCRAFPCHEAKQLALATALDDFESDDPKVKPVNRHELGNLKKVAPLLRLFADRIDAMAYEELSAGRKVYGYKLVEGDRGDREWSEAELPKVREALGKMLPRERYITEKVASPAQIEKLVINKRSTLNRVLTADQWQTLQGWITRNPAQPKVVPDSDPRPALEMNRAADFDFEDVTTSNFFNT